MMNTDPLSNSAREVLRLDVNEAYVELLPRKPGSARAGELLHALSPADLVNGKMANADDAAALLSGLWMWHDYLDESHTVSQQLHTPNGTFWHAIMHRREGDFGNAKYWYAQCRRHTLMPTLASLANEIIAHAPADKALLKLTMGPWDAAGFVDLVQLVHESPSDPRYPIAVALQQLEWRTVFNHCTRGAAG